LLKKQVECVEALQKGGGSGFQPRREWKGFFHLESLKSRYSKYLPVILSFPATREREVRALEAASKEFPGAKPLPVWQAKET